MIARRYARKLLDEYLNRLEKAEEDADAEYLDSDEIRAVAVELLDESPLVIRGTENVAQKAARYVTEGRLRVERIEDSGLIVASCRGSGATYALGYDPKRREWRCQCDNPRPTCAHIGALRLVVDRPKDEGGKR